MRAKSFVKLAFTIAVVFTASLLVFGKYQSEEEYARRTIQTPLQVATIPAAYVALYPVDRLGILVTDGVVVIETEYLDSGRKVSTGTSLSAVIKNGNRIYLEPAVSEHEVDVIYVRLPNGEETGRLRIRNDDYWKAVANSVTDSAMKRSDITCT